VLSDILTALNSGDIAALALLDLSAAFNTVDHSYPTSPPTEVIWTEWLSTCMVHIVRVPAPTTRVTSQRALSNDDHPVQRVTELCTRPDTVRSLHGRRSALGRAARLQSASVMPMTHSFTAVANQEIPHHYVATSASVLMMWHSGCAQIVCN